jgi:serine protease Do
MIATSVSVLLLLVVGQAFAPGLQGRAAASAGRDPVVRVVRLREPSVVSLHVVERTADGKDGETLGSAVVIGSGGLLVTNAHVIEHGVTVHVRTMDGRDLETTVIGRDAEADLALLRCSDSTGLLPVAFGDSAATPVGTFVVAIGNPYGLHHSVSFGILSAKARGLDDSGLEFLQTDAAVNPGNSGGGLFDLDGRLIGITSGILSPPSGGNVGLNFAIPVNVVKALLPQLKAGEVRHGWLGVSMRPTTNPAAPGVALEVLDVAPGGPADESGLLRGDVVISAATAAHAMPASRLHEAVWLSVPGTRLVLEVLRDRQRRAIVVVTGKTPVR